MVNNSLIQDWISKLSWKQQEILFLSLREYDNKINSINPPKSIHYQFHNMVFKNNIMNDNINKIDNIGEWWNDIVDFTHNLRFYKICYVCCILDAVEILMYFHPDKTIQDYWNRVYTYLVNAINLNPETKDQCIARTTGDIQDDGRLHCDA